MVPELEKPRITEIQVRMDCNGCVQKIKKALHGISGIYDLYIDFPQQKLTIIGWADPAKIVKAIRKTRKIATILSHTEPTTEPTSQPSEQPQQPPEGAAPPSASDTPNPPPTEAPLAKASPPADPPPPSENPPPKEKPSQSDVTSEASSSKVAQPPGPNDVGEVHVIYHQPPDYGCSHNYGGHQNRYNNSQGFPPEPNYVTHSYNTSRPSQYVTEYQYIQSPPHRTLSSRMDHYNEGYHDSNHNGNITSMFSDENPNACRVI